MQGSCLICRSLVFLPASQDFLDLETSAEGLVEEQPCLEIYDEWEPRQDGNGGEDRERHQVLIPSCQTFH